MADATIASPLARISRILKLTSGGELDAANLARIFVRPAGLRENLNLHKHPAIRSRISPGARRRRICEISEAGVIIPTFAERKLFFFFYSHR